MSDLISRQAAIDAIKSIPDHEDAARANALGLAENAIMTLPTVQPDHNAEVSKMEIIHCENCEHWDTSWENVYGLHYCPMIDMTTKKNFFCKHGAERKGEAE